MLSVADQAAWTERARAGLNESGVSREQVKRDQVEQVDFYPFFAGLCEKLLNRQKSLWRAYYMIWLRSALYYDGKQILVPRPSGFGYDVKQLRGIDHPLYVYNKLRPYSDDVTSMWVQSSPEVLLAVMDEDDRRAQAIISELETLNTYFNYLHFTEETLQYTARMAQFAGNYHFECWYDPNALNGKEWIEEYAPLQIAESTWYECFDCGQMGEMQGASTCPHCESADITAHHMPGAEVADAIQKSAGWQHVGEVVVKPFPAWSMRYSLTTGASNSPWRYCEEDQPKERVEFTYGKLDAAACNEAHGIEEEMHAERVMRRAERIRGGFESEDDSDNILTQRYWFEPEMLHFYAPKEDVTLPNGEVIPAGERLSDVFADSGMNILTVPGAPKFLNVTRESHLKRFVDGKYGFTPGKNIGHGIEDGVEGQRQYNITESGSFRYLQKTLQPSVAVNNRVFPDSRLFNRLDNTISTNNSGIPEGTSINDHFAYVAAPALNPQIFAVSEKLDAHMQQALKSFSSMSEFAGAENDTATATKAGIGREARNHSIYLALYAGVVKEISIRRLELARDNYKSLRIVNTMDKLSGERKVTEINSISLQTQLVAWVKTGSFMPNLDLEKRAAMLEAVNVATSLSAINMLNPASLQTINKRFNVDLTFEKLNERIDECEETLDLILAAFEQSQGMMPPDMLYALNPVDPATTNHEAKLQWWRDWLSSKEGRTAPQQIKEVARIYIGQEFMALQTEQAYMASLANVGQVVAGMQNAAMLPQDEVPPNQEKNPTDNPMMSEPQGAMPPMTQ